VFQLVIEEAFLVCDPLAAIAAGVWFPSGLRSCHELFAHQIMSPQRCLRLEFLVALRANKALFTRRCTLVLFPVLLQIESLVTYLA